MTQNLSSRSAFAALLLLVALLFAPGCSRETGPPRPLTAETLPRELSKAFGKAAPELKQVVEGIKAAIGAKDYPSAFQGIQYLANAPELTEDQRTMVARAMLTLTGLLQAAQAQGDPKAAEALNNYRINK